MVERNLSTNWFQNTYNICMAKSKKLERKISYKHGSLAPFWFFAAYVL